jgi:hypothetical protein
MVLQNKPSFMNKSWNKVLQKSAIKNRLSIKIFKKNLNEQKIL